MGTTLMTKINNRYGPPGNNNVGVFQVSEISALLFVIYLDGMMEDYQTLNTIREIPGKYTHRNA